MDRNDTLNVALSPSAAFNSSEVITTLPLYFELVVPTAHSPVVADCVPAVVIITSNAVRVVIAVNIAS